MEIHDIPERFFPTLCHTVPGEVSPGRTKRPRYSVWIRTRKIIQFWSITSIVVLVSVLLGLLHPALALFGLFALPILYIALIISISAFVFSPKGLDYQNAIHHMIITAAERNGGVLDIGCGHGSLIIKIAKMNADRNIGLDSWGRDWEYSQSQCEENAEYEGVGNVVFMQGSASNLPFHDASRVLRPGGTFTFLDLFGDRHFYPQQSIILKTVDDAGCLVKRVEHLSQNQSFVYISAIGMNKHVTSILQALLVTFLWSTSFIIIKKSLPIIPPMTFAGLRYFLASLCLLPFAFRQSHRSEMRQLKKGQWIKLLLLGMVFYVLTQGAQFLGLSLLPSATVSLMLNFTPLMVVALGAAFLNEKPTGRQIFGVVLFVAGALVYFLPLTGIGSQAIGLAVMILGVLSNAASSVLGRNVNRKKDLSPFTITMVSMTAGSVVLLSLGLVIEGIPRIPPVSWLSLIWLSAINTAFAFTLWNRTLRHLTAMESSIINGTMLIQIAILAWFLLGETLSMSNIGGMILASVGAILVQLKPRDGRDRVNIGNRPGGVS